MAKPPAPPIATDEEVRAMLEHYRCPVPFHEVRTRFLGNIATPIMSASPIKTVEGLWGGELPDFGSINAANELIGALNHGVVESAYTAPGTQHTLSLDPSRCCRLA